MSRFSFALLFTISTIHLFSQSEIRPVFAVGASINAIDATSLNDYYIDGFNSRLSTPIFTDHINRGPQFQVRTGIMINRIGVLFDYGYLTTGIANEYTVPFTDNMGIETAEVMLFNSAIIMSMSAFRAGISYRLVQKERLILAVEVLAGPAKGDVLLTLKSTNTSFLRNESYMMNANDLSTQGTLHVSYRLSKTEKSPVSLGLQLGYHELSGGVYRVSDGSEWIVGQLGTPDSEPVTLEMSGPLVGLFLTFGL